jgi:hypothetical protein
MNLTDCYVTEVLGYPYFKYERWWVSVKYESWGTVSNSEIMTNTKEEAIYR